MNKTVKRVLKIIENHGYEAYVVGGYVRDYMLNKKTFDIDICTNATPKDLNLIFPGCLNNNYGGIRFKIKKYNFDITTYRKEFEYNNRRPVKIEYINNLLEDINRRDFRINAICMNSDGIIIDIVNGRQDLVNRKITMIGNPDQRIVEDPLRILRAIRFMSNLNFSLDGDLANSIYKNKERILELSHTRVKDELEKILLSQNPKKGLKCLSDFGILKLLGMSYERFVVTKDILGLWAQISFAFNSAFTKEEKNNIIDIQKIINYGRIDNETLYKYGLYLSLVAGEVLGIGKSIIIRKYNKLPIHNKSELAIKTDEIIEILSIKPGSILKKITDDIISNIINYRIKNNYKEIKEFLLQRKGEWST